MPRRATPRPNPAKPRTTRPITGTRRQAHIARTGQLIRAHGVHSTPSSSESEEASRPGRKNDGHAPGSHRKPRSENETDRKAGNAEKPVTGDDQGPKARSVRLLYTDVH